ncbi:RNA polymerase sigma factor, sigma-70 family [Asanoa hainanensis]|uniref:RNA polymerase sigma factor, sigma-70 family n=1 Tax=Asanoa hainanensis TaxID=560556 RepID=A0A239N720_9ACTN|nr:sigma-70 family RNA polymerase sigma factor [Asanoa hainanensis]SNT50234.1 RNA polymerase sigma factor, sigma-70 family [Asanoa hainanensis]
MAVVDTDLTSLATLARTGDQAALDELAGRVLPLVYTVVARALPGDPDLDDVVQDAMVRAVRELPALREPGQFRAWLMAIVVRQVGTHLHRRRVADARSAPLDDADDLPVEDPTMLHAVLSEQRRQVARASRWLDPADRMLLSLWWLEQVGHLTRAELAEAIGARGAHVRVRLQRMREQLELSRSVVAALAAAPRCGGLDSERARWNGTPSPLWRKRLARHVRSCPACQQAGGGQVPIERLLDFALLPVPVAVAAAVIGDGRPVGPARASLLAKVMSALGAHPAVATSATAGLLAVVVAFAVPWSAETEAAPPPKAETGTALPLGPAALEVANQPGQYATTSRTLGVLAKVDASSAESVRRRATFEVTAGIADSQCSTLRTQDGGYLRHMSWRLRASLDEDTALFRGDATFCVRPGAIPGSVSLESSNYPGWFLRHRGGQLWVDRDDGTQTFGADSSFFVRPPWAP